jgi:hypothetical protein
MIRGLVGVIALALSVPGVASAQLLTYKLDGGSSRINAAVGGNTFSNEAWSITATADASTVQSVIFNGIWPTNYAVVNPVLHIGSGSYSLLPMTTGHVWTVFSQSAPGSSGIGFAAFDPTSPNAFSNSFLIMDMVPGATFYHSLTAPVSFVGSPTTMILNNPGPGTYLTGAGLLSISTPNSMFNSGSFSISAAVPEPGEWAAMGILGAGLAGLVLRKRRAA